MTSHRLSRARAASALALLALLATACGSTVATQGARAPGVGAQGGDTLGGPADGGANPGGDGLSDPSLQAPDGSGPGSATTGSSGTGTSTGPGTSSGSGMSSGSGTSSGSQPAGSSGPAGSSTGGTKGTASSGKPPSNARGVTNDNITIGFEYTEGGEAANKAAGFNGVTTGDQRKQLELLIAEVNRTGGIAGRMVKPVFHAYDAASGESTASQEQSACADFTQDHKVFAVLIGGTHTENYISCLGKVGVALVAAPIFTIADSVLLGRNPLYRELNTVDLDTAFELYGQALSSTGFYAKGAKIGLLTLNFPSMERAVKNHLEPALARAGLKLEDKVTLAAPQSNSDLGSFSSAIGSAVLRFRQKGVDHVLITDVNALTTAVFLNAAANQEYYPKYGFNTQNGGQALADIVSDKGKRSLQGSVQLGWAPALDLNAANETIRPPGAKRCLDFFASKGMQATSRNAAGVLALQCDIFFFAQAAGKRVSQLTAQSFVQAYASVGTAVAPASTYQVNFGRGGTGVSAYRVQRWVDACTCYKAEGGLKSLR